MQLEGKIINFLGDSITEGTGVTDKENYRYVNIICRVYGLKAVNNYGIGGTRIAHQSVPSDKPRYDLCFCGRAYNIDPRADITVVYGGVNDYIHGDAPIGTPTDQTPETFWGGVNFLMAFLKERFIGKTVVFMTPARACPDGMSDMIKFNHPAKREDAMPLVGYVDIIKAAGKAHDIPVLDMYHSFPIDPNNEKDRKKYTVDGLHFNNEGHKIIAKHLASFLISL